MSKKAKSRMKFTTFRQQVWEFTYSDRVRRYIAETVRPYLQECARNGEIKHCKIVVTVGDQHAEVVINEIGQQWIRWPDGGAPVWR
jgi:hypothetical protein